MNDKEKKDIELLLNQLKDSEIIDARRNAAADLGTKNSFFELIVPALIEGLNDENWLVRIECAKSLGKIGFEAVEAIDALADSMKEPRNKPKRGVFYENIQLLEKAKREGPTRPVVEEPVAAVKEEIKVLPDEVEEEIIEDVLEDAVEDTLEDSIEDIVDDSVDEDAIEDIAEDIAEEVIEIGEVQEEEITEKVEEIPSEVTEEIIEEVLEESVEDTLEDAIDDVVGDTVDEDVIEDLAEDIAEETVELQTDIPSEPVQEVADVEQPTVDIEAPSEPITESVPAIDEPDLTEVRELLDKVEESLEEEIVPAQQGTDEKVEATATPAEPEVQTPETLESEAIEELKSSVPLDDVLEFKEDKEEPEKEKKSLLTLPTDEKPSLSEDVPTIKMSRTILKLVVVGDELVGKTTLLESFDVVKFQREYKDVIGADFVTKHVTIDDEEFALQMWDLSGSKRVDATQQLFYNGTKGALLVFDVTRRDTYDNITKWLDDILKYETVEAVILGNKIDLRTPDQDCVTTEQGQELANRLSKKLNKTVQYFETTATDTQVVKDAFNLLVNKTLKSYKDSIQE